MVYRQVVRSPGGEIVNHEESLSPKRTMDRIRIFGTELELNSTFIRIKGALLRSRCCMFVRTTQIFDKEPVVLLDENCP